MKKTFQLAIFLMISGITSINAQVTIGSAANPHPGAILDLSAANNMGLLLPQVSLNKVGDWQIGGNSADAAGMMIYNTNDNTDGGAGRGIYIWNGSVWSPIAKLAVAAAEKVIAFDVMPSDPEVSIFTGSSLTFMASNFMPATASYPGVNWTLSGAGNHVQITSPSMTQCTVKGLSQGDAVLNIVSLDGAKSKNITIHVVDITVKSFTLPPTLSMLTTAPATLTASNFTGSDNQPMNEVTVVWSTENGTITAGTVTQGSNTTTITAGSIGGTFTVKATAGNITNDCLVTVTKVGLDSEQIGLNTYQTYTYPDGTTWMVENSKEGTPGIPDAGLGGYYSLNEAETEACPGSNWNVPTEEQWKALQTYINKIATSVEKKWWNSGDALAGHYEGNPLRPTYLNQYGEWFCGGSTGNGFGATSSDKNPLEGPLSCVSHYCTVRCVKSN